MRRLTRPVTRRLGHEDGAVAVVIAILAVVLLGMVALAVDVGALYQERRELQNGADAAALAIAEDCARDLIECTVDNIEWTLAEGTAQDYADDNAEDQASYVENLDIDPASATVKVDLLSQDADTGDTALYHWFAPVLGFDSSEVRASATARWNTNPATLRIFPLTFCEQTFLDVTSGGDDFGPPEYRVFYKKPGDEEAIECELEDGDTYPGGFGWLNIEDPFYDLEEPCHVTVGDEEWYPGKVGNAISSDPGGPWVDCEDYIKDTVQAVENSDEEDPCSQPAGDPDVEPLLVPIFDDWDGEAYADEDEGEFHIAGFGAFCPTGYRFKGDMSYPDPATEPCNDPDNRCVRGWFTEWVEFEDAFGGDGDDFGVTTITLIE